MGGDDGSGDFKIIEERYLTTVEIKGHGVP